MKKSFYAGLVALTVLGGAGAVAVHALGGGSPVVQGIDGSLTPLTCSMTGSLDIDVAAKKMAIKISVTAPTEGYGDGDSYLPLTSIDEITLYRSVGYEDDVFVTKWTNPVPGGDLEFVDDSSDLVAGKEYTYSAIVTCGDKQSSRKYAYVTFGIIPFEPDSPVLTCPTGAAPVVIKVTCPAAECGTWWNSEPFPAGVTHTSLDIFQKDADGNDIILKSFPNPTPGESYTYEDNNAKDGQNYYYVRACTDFGNSDYARGSIWIGPDAPAKVSDLQAVEVDGSIKITWTAPEEGYNGGTLDPESVIYSVYRYEEGSGKDWVLLSDNVTECEYIDDLDGVDAECYVSYRVIPRNDVECDGYVIAETRGKILAGPPSPLPYVETFNGGTKFNKVFSRMWEESFDMFVFDVHYLRADQTVTLADGTELDVPTGVDGGSASDDNGVDYYYYVKAPLYYNNLGLGYLTSGNISLEKAANPVVSFHYVPTPGSSGSVTIEITTGELDEKGAPVFKPVGTVTLDSEYSIPQDKDENTGADAVRAYDAADAEPASVWKKATLSLAEYASEERVKIRLGFQWHDLATRTPILVDQICVDDYPAATDLNVAQDGTNLKLTWNLPESAGDKEVKYNIYLNDNTETPLATVSETEYVYENAVQGETYLFTVETVYADGTEAGEASQVEYTVPLVSFVIDGVTYGVSDDVVEAVGYEGESADVTIPAKVEYNGKEFEVAAIADALFKGNRTVKNVVIETPVEVLGAEMFYGCTALESVKLPASVNEIADKAFFGCSSLKGIELPEAILKIGASAFENCTSITEIAFGPNLFSIGERAFANCSSLAKVTFVTTYAPTVGTDAFKGVATGCKGVCPDDAVLTYEDVETLSPIDFSGNGIDGIDGDDVVAVEYYNLSGVRVSEPEAGQPVIARIICADGSVKTVRLVKSDRN